MPHPSFHLCVVHVPKWNYNVKCWYDWRSNYSLKTVNHSHLAVRAVCFYITQIPYKHRRMHLFLARINYYDISISKRKRNRSDSVLWQKSLNPQKNIKNSNVTTQKRHEKKNRLHNDYGHDLGLSIGVTIANQLVWLNRLTGSQPSHSQKGFKTKPNEIVPHIRCIQTSFFMI